MSETQFQIKPIEKATDVFDFNARSAEISAAEKIRQDIAREAAENAARAGKLTEEGILLQLEGSTQLNRVAQTNDGLLGIIQTVRESGGVGKGIKNVLSDVSGLTERQAKDKLQRGVATQQIAALEEAARQRELDASGAKRLSPFVAAEQKRKLGADVIGFQNEQQSLALRTRTANLTAARLNFDVQEAERTNRIHARDDYLENLTVGGADAILQALDDSNQTEFVTSDPNTGAKFALTKDQLIQHRKNRTLMDAELTASIATAGMENATATAALDESILGKMPINQLRALQANEGVYSFQDTQTGESINKIFDPRAVDSVLQEREAVRNNRSLGIGALDPASDPLIQSATKRIQTSLNVFSTVQNNLESLFPSGALAGDLLLQSSEIENDLSEGMRMAQALAEGEIAMTPEIEKKYGEAIQQLNKNVSDYADKAASQFAAGDADLQQFVKNRLTGAYTNPEVLGEAFSLLSTSEDTVLTSMSTQAVRGAMEGFVGDFRDRINHAAEMAGAVAPPIKGNGGTQDILAFLSSQDAKKSSKLSQEQLKELRSEALTYAGQIYQSDALDSLLKGDFRMLPLDAQEKLSAHPFVNLPLDKIYRRAELRLQNQAKANKVAPTDPSMESVFYTAYAQILQETAVDDPKFSNGFELYADFVGQQEMQRGLQSLAKGAGAGTLADQAASELYGGQAANFLANRLNYISETGLQVGIQAEEAVSSGKSAYRNDGIKRLQEILVRSPNEVVTESQIKPFVQHVRRQVVNRARQNGADPGIQPTNAMVEHFIFNTPLENPELESIRKKLIREWKSIAPITDRGFFARETEDY